MLGPCHARWTVCPRFFLKEDVYARVLSRPLQPRDALANPPKNDRAPFELVAGSKSPEPCTALSQTFQGLHNLYVLVTGWGPRLKLAIYEKEAHLADVVPLVVHDASEDGVLLHRPHPTIAVGTSCFLHQPTQPPKKTPDLGETLLQVFVHVATFLRMGRLHLFANFRDRRPDAAKGFALGSSGCISCSTLLQVIAIHSRSMRTVYKFASTSGNHRVRRDVPNRRAVVSLDTSTTASFSRCCPLLLLTGSVEMLHRAHGRLLPAFPPALAAS